MKHAETRQLAPAPQSAKKSKGSNLLWVLATAGLIGAAGTFATWAFVPNALDRPAQSEIEARQAAFSQVRELSLAAVPNERLESALDGMRLQPVDRKTLSTSMQNAKQAMADRPSADSSSIRSRQNATASSAAEEPLRLAEVSLFDTHAEDGDIIAVESAGYRREVVLTKTPQLITIPVDSTALFRITGVRDGGGGITLGLRGSSQQVMAPIMSEGQTISLPIAR